MPFSHELRKVNTKCHVSSCFIFATAVRISIKFFLLGVCEKKWKNLLLARICSGNPSFMWSSHLPLHIFSEGSSRNSRRPKWRKISYNYHQGPQFRVIYWWRGGLLGGVVGWGTALQAGRSRFSIPGGVNGPGVDSASKRNEYQGYLLGRGGGKGGRCVGLTSLPPSCAYCLEILGASTSWSPKGLSRPVVGLLYVYWWRVPSSKSHILEMLHSANWSTFLNYILAYLVDLCAMNQIKRQCCKY
jgi:hypothetical protein